jgi:hypothetical protein
MTEPGIACLGCCRLPSVGRSPALTTIVPLPGFSTLGWPGVQPASTSYFNYSQGSHGTAASCLPSVQSPPVRLVYSHQHPTPTTSTLWPLHWSLLIRFFLCASLLGWFLSSPWLISMPCGCPGRLAFDN